MRQIAARQLRRQPFNPLGSREAVLGLSQAKEISERIENPNAPEGYGVLVMLCKKDGSMATTRVRLNNRRGVRGEDKTFIRQLMATQGVLSASYLDRGKSMAIE